MREREVRVCAGVLTLRAGVAGPDTVNIVLNGKPSCCFCLGAPTPPHQDSLRERNPNNPCGTRMAFSEMEKHHWNIPVNASIASGMPAQLAGRCDPAAFAEFMTELGAQDAKRTDKFVKCVSIACMFLPCVMIPLICSGKSLWDNDYLPGVKELLAQRQPRFCQRLGCTSISLVEYRYETYKPGNSKQTGWREHTVSVVRLEWPPSQAPAGAPPPPHHHKQPADMATSAPANVTMNP